MHYLRIGSYLRQVGDSVKSAEQKVGLASVLCSCGFLHRNPEQTAVGDAVEQTILTEQIFKLRYRQRVVRPLVEGDQIELLANTVVDIDSAGSGTVGHHQQHN